MCGIIGEIRFSGNIDKEREKEIDISLRMLEKRGPDAEGKYVKDNVYLGHRRLTILDLSEKANQPMTYKNLIIVFNGEIYNFNYVKEELMEKGHKFKTTCDTEVVLHAYEEWGENCVKRFDGMWAFAIYDTEKERLFLSRDRIGEKPLIYYKDKEKFMFCSEIPPIRKILKNPQYNWDALSNFCLYNFKHIPAPYTAYRELFKLEPGHNITLENGILTKSKYFRLAKDHSSRFRDFGEVLSKSIKQTKISDAPVGVFLSGGVDSSLICSYLKDHKITTYTLGQNENDSEIIRAKKIAKKLGLENKTIYIEKSKIYSNLISEIKKLVEYYGEPINLLQILYSDLILDVMGKDKIKVAIGGNGADEIFYGYDGQNRLKLISTIKKLYDKIRLRHFIKSKKGPFQYLNIRNEAIKIQMYKNKVKKRKHIKEKYRRFLYEKEMREYGDETPSKEMIDVFNWQGIRIENEHSITNVADIAGARRGIEIRTPFLNKNMLDYAINLKHKYKVRSFFSRKENKYVMKKLLEKRIGKEFAYFKKMGFGYNVNFGDIVKRFRSDFDHYFNNILPKIEVYDTENIRKMYQDHLKGIEKNEKTLIEILIVCIWFERELR